MTEENDKKLEEKKNVEVNKENEENIATGEKSSEKPLTPVYKTDSIKQTTKKEEAVSNPVNLHISKKHAIYISKMIKNKSIDTAIKQLEEVLKYKRAVPFKGEIPHRKGRGMMSGRYPQNASKVFINILKGLRGNALVNGMDLEKTRITMCSASWASRPRKVRGGKMKRTNIIIKAREFK